MYELVFVVNERDVYSKTMLTIGLYSAHELVKTQGYWHFISSQKEEPECITFPEEMLHDSTQV